MPAMQPSPEPSPAPVVSSHDRILQAAKQLFASKGYENTSTVAIARAAGTSESQLIKHFGSKEGLLEAIFDQGWQKMSYVLRSVHDLTSPSEKLRALLDMVLTSLDRDAELKQLMLLEGRRIRKEGHMIMLTGGYLALVKVVDSVLAEMKASGELLPGMHLEAVRSAIMGMMEGLMRDQILAVRVNYPAGYRSAELRKIFDVVLGSFTVKQ